MRDLLDRLHTIEAQQNELREEHAAVIRAIVARAGGVSQAAALLDLDPKTVRARERAVGVSRSSTAVSTPQRSPQTGGSTARPARARTARPSGTPTACGSKDKRPLLRAVVYVVDGQVARVREVQNDLWQEDTDGKVALPLSPPLATAALANRFPTLPLTIGTPRPMVWGRIREYIAL